MAQIIRGLGEKCLDIVEKDASICLYATHGWASQQFELTQDGYITSPLDPTKCLQVADANATNGSGIVFVDKQDKPHQKWSYDPITGCFISALDNNKCLAVQNDLNQNGTPIVLMDKNNSQGQRWRFNTPPIPIPANFSYLAENMIQTNCEYHILEGKGLQTFCCHYPNGNITVPPVVSGAFNKGLPFQWRAHTNLDITAFQKQLEVYTQQGYRLCQLSVFSTMRSMAPKDASGFDPLDRIKIFRIAGPQQVDVLYSGIWRKSSPGETVHTYLKIRDAEFDAYWNKYTSSGAYCVDDHIRYKLHGEIFHAVVFSNQNKNGFILWHSQTIDNMYKKNEECKSKGFQMVSFHTYYEGNQLLFGGIWQLTGKDSLFLLDMTVQQFQQRCSELEPLGYTLQKIQVYNRGNLEKYGAIWTKMEAVAFNTQVPTIKRISLLTLAPQARWEGGELIDSDNVKDANALPWQGSEGDSRGFVRLNDMSMEDNVVYKALRMHPRWVNRGTIKGWLPKTPLPRQSCFTAKVGFVNGARGSDGVTFQVWAHVDNTWAKVAETYKPYNGSLQTIWADLSHLDGKQVGIELRVDSGASSGQDWAAWIDPCIVGFDYGSGIKFTNFDKILKFDPVLLGGVKVAKFDTPSGVKVAKFDTPIGLGKITKF